MVGRGGNCSCLRAVRHLGIFEWSRASLPRAILNRFTRLAHTASIGGSKSAFSEALLRERGVPVAHERTAAPSLPTDGSDSIDARECDERYPGPSDSVVVAMSGGVDSSVAAYLLSKLFAAGKIAGLRAVYMRNWIEAEETGEGGHDHTARSNNSDSETRRDLTTGSVCQWKQEWEDVQKVCAHLNLPEPELIDLSKEYWLNVFEPALQVWSSGVATPNPDVSCNREIKFGILLDKLLHSFVESSQRTGKAQQQGKLWLATGHYARTGWTKTVPDGRRTTWVHQYRPLLLQPFDLSKDQTMWLSSIPSTRLRHALFPLSNLLKDEVRVIAEQVGLPTAARKESMGLCFVGERGQQSIRGPAASKGQPERRLRSEPAGVKKGEVFGRWLSSYMGNEFLASPASHVDRSAQGDRPASTEGPLIEYPSNRVLGHHSGLHTLTIGQRARVAGSLAPLFVASKDPTRSAIILVPGRDHPALRGWEVTVEHLGWNTVLPKAQSRRGAKMWARFRPLSESIECTVFPGQQGSKTARIVLDQPVQGASAGQVVALYAPVVEDTDGTLQIISRVEQNNPGSRMACLGSGVIAKVKTEIDALA